MLIKKPLYIYYFYFIDSIWIFWCLYFKTVCSLSNPRHFYFPHFKTSFWEGSIDFPGWHMALKKMVKKSCMEFLLILHKFLLLLSSYRSSWHFSYASFCLWSRHWWTGPTSPGGRTVSDSFMYSSWYCLVHNRCTMSAWKESDMT